MSDEVVEMFGTAEIMADGIAKVHLIGSVVRLCFWKWEHTESGLIKACAGKLFITKEGMIASRPQISSVLGTANPNIIVNRDQMTAH